MAKKDTKDSKEIEQENQTTNAQPEPETAEAEKQPEQAAAPEKSELELAREALAKEHEAYLRLAAEYDNFRKRTQKETDSTYLTAKADTIGKFLTVFDNLERAVEQPTEDEAYKKGVEMTLSGLREVMKSLGVEEFGEKGDKFDPNMHNAVMHTEDENHGESELSQVFQKGFKVGDRVIRFAMVQVAN